MRVKVIKVEVKGKENDGDDLFLQKQHTEKMGQHLQIAGQSIWVEKIQAQTGKNGPCLVFLHEGLGSVEMWKRLSGSVYVSLPDYPDYFTIGWDMAVPVLYAKKEDAGLFA